MHDWFLKVHFNQKYKSNMTARLAKAIFRTVSYKRSRENKFSQVDWYCLSWR